MIPEIKADWLAALRSGEYSQTKGALKDGIGYCCLGVLCDLAEKAGVAEFVAREVPNEYGPEHEPEIRTGYVEKGDDTPYPDNELLPHYVRDWAGMDDINPYVTSGMDEYGGTIRHTLADLNDDHDKDFTEIAAYIEEQIV